MLTRRGVAKQLGKSVATVRRLEGSELHPTADACGVHRFPRAQVERLRRRIRDGQAVSAARGEWLRGNSRGSARPGARAPAAPAPVTADEAVDTACRDLAAAVLDLLLRHQRRPHPLIVEYLNAIASDD